MKRMVGAWLVAAVTAAAAPAASSPDWLARLEEHASLARAAARGNLSAAARLAGVSVPELRLAHVATPTRRRAPRSAPEVRRRAPVRRRARAPKGAALSKAPVAPSAYQVTSEFGPRGGRPHEGIDLAAKPGTRVVAMGTGRVVEACWRNGWGHTVLVEHPDGITTRYAHLRRRPKVRVGQPVHPGTVLGEVGSSGRASGPHLHLEVRAAGKARNPRQYWKF